MVLVGLGVVESLATGALLFTAGAQVSVPHRLKASNCGIAVLMIFVRVVDHRSTPLRAATGIAHGLGLG
jgi:hypothetical protein